MVKNPKGNERKYRPGIMKAGMVGSGNKTFEGSTREEAETEREKLMRLEQGNQVWHQFLADVRHERVRLPRPISTVKLL